MAVTQLSNVLGREYPIEKLAEIAHRKNAVMVADGAQSTPHIAVDVKSLGWISLRFQVTSFMDL